MSVPTISPTAAHDRLGSVGSGARLIDVRTPAEFEAVHARGAESVPLDRLDPAAMGANGGGGVYVICQSGGRSAKACERLMAAGLAGVCSVEGGTTAWEAAGLPVERGASRVISIERQVRIVAGTLVVIGTVLGWAVHRAFLGVPLFVGSGLVFAGVTDFCGMGMLLARMPWNQRGGGAADSVRSQRS